MHNVLNVRLKLTGCSLLLREERCKNITLFSGVFFGMITGILEPFKKIASLIIIIEKSQKKWIVLSILLVLIFALISSWTILSSNFSTDSVW